MKLLTYLATMISFSAAAPVFGQWSTNPASPMVAADGANDQTQPKVVPTGDGGCYISWLDNSVAGYDVRLQRLSAAGVEQWAHNGIVVADRALTSTTDYDLIIDGAGNAVLAFADDLVSPPTKVVVQRVSPAGVKLWGNGSIVADGSGNIHVSALSDGTFGVAWSQSPLVRIARLNQNGVRLGAVKSISEQVTATTFHTVFIADCCAGDNGSMIVMWNRSFGTSYSTTSRWIYAQKFDTFLNEVWPSTALQTHPPFAAANAVPVYAPAPNQGGYGPQGGSIQNGYFPGMTADGSGGFYTAIYENSNTRQAYVQHILPNGTPKFAGNGLSSGLPTTRLSLGASAVWNPVTDEYVLAWPESASPTQGNYSVNAQKFDSSGTAQWAGSVTILPTGTGNQPSFVNVVGNNAGGGTVFCINTNSTLTSVIYGSSVNGDGSIRWEQAVCSTEETHSRLTATRSSMGDPLIVYGRFPFGLTDSYAQRVLPNGEIGFCHADIGAQGGIVGRDAQLDNNDFVVFINAFFALDALADFGQQGGVAGSDGTFDNNDFVVFINEFFVACQ